MTYILKDILTGMQRIDCWTSRSGSRGTSQEVIALIQVRNDGSSDQDGRDGGNEKWSHSVYILIVEPTDFPDEQKVGCESIERK